MSPLVRRVSLIAAAAGAAGLFATTAIAADKPRDLTVQRHVMVIDGPDGEELRLDTAEFADQFHQFAGQMMPMVRQLGANFETDPAQRAEHLREMLQLRPDQETALQAFISSAHDQPRVGPAMHEMDENLTTPQRLDRARAAMAERNAAFERRAQAVSRFYGQLSPSQKKVFDKLPGADGMGQHEFRIMKMGGPGKPFRLPTLPPPPKTPG